MNNRLWPINQIKINRNVKMTVRKLEKNSFTFGATSLPKKSPTDKWYFLASLGPLRDRDLYTQNLNVSQKFLNILSKVMNYF